MGYSYTARLMSLRDPLMLVMLLNTNIKLSFPHLPLLEPMSCPSLTRPHKVNRMDVGASVSNSDHMSLIIQYLNICRYFIFILSFPFSLLLVLLI